VLLKIKEVFTMRLWRTVTTLGWKFWASEVIMVTLGAYNFTVSAQQWGWGNANATVSQGGVLSAATLELGLIVFLHLARFGFFATTRTGRTLAWAGVWAVVSALLAYISLHNNQLYFQGHWTPADGDPTIELWVRCVVPMGIMFLCALVPPGRATYRTQAEIDAEYDEKVHEARRQNELALIKTHSQQDRRALAARERAIHTQLLRLAGKDAAQYQVDNDGITETDWLSLEADLAAQGLWDSTRQAPATPVRVTPALDEQDEPPNTITDNMPSLPRTKVPALPAGEGSNQQGGEQDKMQRTLEALVAQPDITDDDLADVLGLEKAASARYWRLKATALLAGQQGKVVTMAPAASNGHNREEDQAASRSPFRGDRGRKKAARQDDEEDDDFKGWDQ
jgi:hypothetical protein